MQKAETETQRARLEEQLREICNRELPARLRLGDVSDRIKNAQIGMSSPDFLASQLPSAIQTLRDDLRRWNKEKKAMQKEIDDLMAERRMANEKLNGLMNPYYGLQGSPGQSS
jgi:chromosome segregation ATPase